MRLLAGLHGMFRTGRDLFAAVFLFLLDFFVVGNVTWVCHGSPVCWGMQGLSEPVLSQCATGAPGDTAAMPELVWEGSHATTITISLDKMQCTQKGSLEIIGKTL